MRLRHIEVFNAVMLTGSVSAAARLINVTQPAVSRILAHAELQLGFALFQRVKGRLVPTSEAQTLYPHIERLFQQLDEVQRLASSLRQGQREDELHLLAVLALSHEILPRALHLFCAQHPQVRVTVDALHSPQIISALVLQEADLGLVFSSVTHPSLEQQALAQGSLMCVAPRGLLDRTSVKQGVISLEQVAAHPVIGLDARDPMGTQLNHACREADVRLQAAVTVQTYHAALALAHHGIGIALVDSCTAISADAKRVDVLRLEPQIPVPIRALRPAHRPSTLLAQAMTRCVKQVLAQTRAAQSD